MPSGARWNRFSLFMLSCALLAQSGCGAPPAAKGNPNTPPPPNVGNLEPIDLTPPPEDPMAHTGVFEPHPGGMMGALGFNLESYLAEDIQDPIARIKRLERAVIAMQSDLRTAAPALQTMSTEQEMVVPANPMGPPAPVFPPETAQKPAPPEPVVTTLAKPEPAPQPAPAAAGTSVTALRVGEHPDKIRLVLDITDDTPYYVDLDNNEKLLVIELKEAGWSAPAEQNYTRPPLLKRYKVETTQNGKGSLVIIQLSSASDIISQSKLKGENSTGARIVVDLKK